MNEFLRLGLIVALTLGLLWIDRFIPLGVAIGVLYACVLFLAATSSYHHMPAIIATISSLFIVVGGMGLNIENIPVWMIATNRALSLFIIWVSLFFLLQRRRDVEALRRAHGELEVRVQDRTAELATVNKALVVEITERIETESSLRISEAALATSQRALQRSGEDLRGLAARLLTAQEEERRRISRDLHDDINQRLAMMVVELETLDRMLPVNCQQIGTRLRSLQDNATELSDDVRHLSVTYHPAFLDDLGLEVALKRLVDDLSTRTGLHGTFQGTSVARTISQPVATCLYRIAQESLSNVVKHADASKFGIELNCSSEWVTLAVTDDGKGFDPMSRKQERASLGLVSMKERAHLVKGELDVESTVGRGTLIRVRIPLSTVRP